MPDKNRTKTWDKLLYRYTIAVRIFQLIPQWIPEDRIIEVFKAITECMNIVVQMEVIKFDNTDEDIEAFSNFITKFKTVRDRHEISSEIGLKDSAVRIGIGEYLTDKIKDKSYRHYYEYLHIIEGWL